MSQIVGLHSLGKCSSPWLAGSRRDSKNRTRRIHAPRCERLDEQDTATEGIKRPFVIKPPPLLKSPADPPQAAPIEHSSAYLLRTSKHIRSGENEFNISYQATKPYSSSSLSSLDDNTDHLDDQQPVVGNAVDWMLRKADESLDAVEQDPPAYAKAIYQISTGPIGTTASKGAVAAAKLTLEAGNQALKAAAPVGKWVLAQGAKAVGGAIMKGLSPKKNKSKK